MGAGERTSEMFVVVGPPGAGTSTVGRLLAERTGLAASDSDREVEARLGAPAAEIFLEQGEEIFRDAEREVALELLAGGSGVVVLGGGAVVDPLVADAVHRAAGRAVDGARAGARVVFLDVTISDAARRLGLNAERPSGIGAPRAQWIRMMEQRRPQYAGLADITVSTDGLTPEQVTDRVVDALASQAAGAPTAEPQ